MLWSLFSLEGRQAECHNRLFLQNGHDQICVRLARSKSLATHTSFTDYAGNGKHILKIMEDKENKRVLNKYPDFHPDGLTTFGGRSLTLQVNGQVKKRRKEKYK